MSEIGRAIAYWDGRSTHWRVSRPLSPDPTDIEFYAASARDMRPRERPLEALLLGATPAIGAMAWPEGARVAAVDWSGGMLEHVWKPARIAGCHPLRADWHELPFANDSFDLAVGDGCYSTFENLEGARALNADVARVLRTGGAFCIRTFARPARAESLDQLFAGLADRKHANLDLFRWRIAMALHGSDGNGVALADVWAAWHDHVPDPTAHPARVLWSDTALEILEGWREARSRYVFPTVDELRRIAQPHFEVEACEHGTYELAERFPRLRLRRR